MDLYNVYSVNIVDLYNLYIHQSCIYLYIIGGRHLHSPEYAHRNIFMRITNIIIPVRNIRRRRHFKNIQNFLLTSNLSPAILVLHQTSSPIWHIRLS